MEEFLKVGLIVKPQGIKGEVKVMPLTDDINRFRSLKEGYIDGQPVKITGVKLSGDGVILSIFGVNDRNVAETFRNKFIFVDRENAVKPNKNAFFIADLIGAKVCFESGKVLGTITDITKSKTDFFTIETIDGKTMRFPFLKDTVINVDEKACKITVDEKRFSEISFYED